MIYHIFPPVPTWFLACYVLVLAIGLLVKVKIIKSFRKPVDKKRNPW